MPTTRHCLTFDPVHNVRRKQKTAGLPGSHRKRMGLNHQYVTRQTLPWLKFPPSIQSVKKRVVRGWQHSAKNKWQHIPRGDGQHKSTLQNNNYSTKIASASADENIRVEAEDRKKKIPPPVSLTSKAYWKGFRSAVHTTSRQFSEAAQPYGKNICHAKPNTEDR